MKSGVDRDVPRQKEKTKGNWESLSQQSVFLNLIVTQTPTEPFHLTTFETIFSSLNRIESALYRFFETLWRNTNPIRWNKILSFGRPISPKKRTPFSCRASLRKVSGLSPLAGRRPVKVSIVTPDCSRRCCACRRDSVIGLGLCQSSL